MRKMVFLWMVFMIFQPSFGQTQHLPASQEGYLQKSNNQKKTGWILLASGTTAMVVGAIVMDNSDFWSADSSFDAGGFLFLGGLVADLVSIPLFISSSNNAHKAATISFSTQQLVVPQLETSTVKNYPSITLRLDL